MPFLLTYPRTQASIAMLDTNSSLAAALPYVVPAAQFTSSSSANGSVNAKIAGYGWPSALVTLSPNPFDGAPMLTNSPINGRLKFWKQFLCKASFSVSISGMPLYALIGTSDASVLQIDIDSAHIVDSMTGADLKFGPVVSYSNNAAPQYSFVYGPFSEPTTTNHQPLYFDIAVRTVTRLSIGLSFASLFWIPKSLLDLKKQCTWMHYNCLLLIKIKIMNGSFKIH